MSGKEMEGSNRQRRMKAREARERGRRASEQAATLGASKQRHHVPDDEDHGEKIETIREAKQKVIRENTPEERPRKIGRAHV